MNFNNIVNQLNSQNRKYCIDKTGYYLNKGDHFVIFIDVCNNKSLIDWYSKQESFILTTNCVDLYNEKIYAVECKYPINLNEIVYVF